MSAHTTAGFSSRRFAAFVALTALFSLILPVEGVFHASLTCGSTIPIDSQFIFDPVWSLSPYRNMIRRASGSDMEVRKGSVSGSVRSIVESESGMNPNSVTLFLLNPSPLDAPSDSSEVSDSDNCSVFIDPLRAAMAGARSKAARIVFVSIANAEGGTCTSPVNITVMLAGKHRSILLQNTESSTDLFVSQSISLGADRSDVQWPVTITFPFSCQMTLLLLANREGRIDRWYVWIPTTVYTGVVTALMIPAVFVPSKMPTGLVSFDIFIVFLGYLSSCVGLIIELINWQSSLGRMFPFPSSVTLYVCLCALYALYMVPLVYRAGHYRIMLTGVLRLLVYGLNCALCVGYWICGYPILGSLALFQYLATNFILTFYYARVSVHLRKASHEEGQLKFAHVFTYMWFAPVTPFAACALMYSDLYMISRHGAVRMPSDARLRDVVYVYNAQMSIPLLFFQNIYGVALIAAATAFHMPFIVVLFFALWLFSLHFIYTLDVYVREYHRWRNRGAASMSRYTCCGWITLTPIMNFLLKRTVKPSPGHDGYGGYPPAHSGGQIPQGSPGGSVDRHSSVVGTSARRRHAGMMTPQQPPRQSFTGGAIAYDDDRNESLYFPPMPQSADMVNTPTASVRADDYEEGDEGDDDFHSGASPVGPPAAESQFWPTDVEK